MFRTSKMLSVRAWPSAFVTLFAVCLMAASGCVYRVPIQQGNFLETKDVDQVMVGMTRAQVRYALGTPMIVDPFSSDRWDYIYYLKEGRMRAPERRHFIVYFENGNVARIEKPEFDEKKG